MAELRHRFEAVVARSAWAVLQALPLDVASALGSRLLRLIGPRLRAHRIAERNLRRAFPDKSDADIATILRGMWDNLGRTLAELPHIGRIVAERVEVVGAENVLALRDDGRPGLLFSGHLGNWELSGPTGMREGLAISLFFRAPNNPLVADIYARMRAGPWELLPKGREGAKQALALLKGGAHLGLLVDQKMNDGIPVPFFGRDAMTAPALAQLAQRFDCPVIPARVIRKGGAWFRVEYLPPMDLPAAGTDRHAAIAETMERVNQRLEEWVREYPEQWLWVHRRWPD